MTIVGPYLMLWLIVDLNYLLKLTGTVCGLLNIHHHRCVHVNLNTYTYTYIIIIAILHSHFGRRVKAFQIHTKLNSRELDKFAHI